MSPHGSPQRLALVVHPTRPLERALEALREWATAHAVDVVQLEVDGRGDREVAELGTLQPDDVVVALGGDGTVLSALRAATASGVPVLGVACGSLGALSAVSAGDLAEALDRVRAGDWTARSLPALSVSGPDGAPDWAINDFVVLRHGAGQVVVDVAVEDELYVRLAGDGLIVATPAGSSGYSMAAGGPMLAADAAAFVCTPLAMHGGSAPPLVVRADATVKLEVHPGFAGFQVEIDGHRRQLEAGSFELTLRQSEVDLVTFAVSGQVLSRLRERGLISDSPRVLARDRRAAVEK